MLSDAIEGTELLVVIDNQPEGILSRRAGRRSLICCCHRRRACHVLPDLTFDRRAGFYPTTPRRWGMSQAFLRGLRWVSTSGDPFPGQGKALWGKVNKHAVEDIVHEGTAASIDL